MARLDVRPVLRCSHLVRNIIGEQINQIRRERQVRSSPDPVAPLAAGDTLVLIGAAAEIERAGALLVGAPAEGERLARRPLALTNRPLLGYW